MCTSGQHSNCDSLNSEEIPIECQKFIKQFCDKVVVNTKNENECLDYFERANIVIFGYNHLAGVKGY